MKSFEFEYLLTIYLYGCDFRTDLNMDIEESGEDMLSIYGVVSTKTKEVKIYFILNY